MILTKQFLNEQVQKRALFEHVQADRKSYDEYDVFISYSWNDRNYANKVVQLLEKCGFTVYIDFEDNSLNRDNVTQQTALTLIKKMKKCKALLYLHSPSAKVSKWCPWELGSFSGLRDFRCAYIPLLDKQGEDFKNQEYLMIYPYVDYSKSNKGNDCFWICESDKKYVELKQWVNGQLPFEHN